MARSAHTLLRLTTLTQNPVSLLLKPLPLYHQQSWHTGAADSWQAWAQQRQPLQQHLLQQQQQQQRRAFGAWSRSGQRWRPEIGGCGSATAISSSSGTSGTSSGIVGSRLAAATAISSSSGSAAAPAAHHQLQQARGLLGRAGSKPKRVNHQDHNKRRPKRTKIKTRSVLKHRVIVDKDGVMWRTQAARRHKRVKKSRGRLSELKGLAPLSAGWARRLRKLGYDRRWWHVKKA